MKQTGILWVLFLPGVFLYGITRSDSLGTWLCLRPVTQATVAPQTTLSLPKKNLTCARLQRAGGSTKLNRQGSSEGTAGPAARDTGVVRPPAGVTLDQPCQVARAARAAKSQKPGLKRSSGLTS
ncbi:hypothetical protein GGR56DRAFT_611914 [Xylariaceae sp. FL0804]|nr:hypothetical protein GGR56DRAFT_611914 [Xylariaceae sp. FL0804]